MSVLTLPLLLLLTNTSYLKVGLKVQTKIGHMESCFPNFSDLKSFLLDQNSFALSTGSLFWKI